MPRHTETIAAVPLHGQSKLYHEGYRTRDGHFIEWFAKLAGGPYQISVYSRPEPHALRWRRRYRYPSGSVREHTSGVESGSWRLPNPLDPKRWWVTSAGAYPSIASPDLRAAFIWNPLYALSPSYSELSDGSSVPIILDLLDDWTVHFAFRGIADRVEIAYSEIFGRADVVTANSEGTVALANRFGRTDVQLVSNGCDPERFTPVSKASGALTIGYLGKVGRRLDVDLIRNVAQRLPTARFVFAGPVLDRETGIALGKISNIELIGDVHYNNVPELLETFDLGWVPHNVGEFEVGGDVIKAYEYRAAKLPVVTTPVIGAGERGLGGTFVCATADEHFDVIRELGRDGRCERIDGVIPVESTWRYKANLLLTSAGIPSQNN